MILIDCGPIVKSGLKVNIGEFQTTDVGKVVTVDKVAVRVVLPSGSTKLGIVYAPT